MSDSEVSAGRIQRLRHELRDEQIWVPEDPDLADLLFAELDYARHPHAHEGTAPRYGALIATRQQPTSIVEPVSFIDVGTVPLDVLRRLADGRSSFVVRAVGSGDRLMCFDRTREFESSAVHLAIATGAFVVQRLGQGWVRLTTLDGIATWDGIRWAKKPLSVRIAECIAPTLPGADPAVLANLVEFSTHWLGAGRVGAAIVWRLDGDARELGGLGFGSAVEIPPLDLTDRTHFAPLLNALSQYDRAALDRRQRVRRDGRGAPAEFGTIAPRHRAVPRDPPHLGTAVLRRRAERRRVRRVLGRRTDGRTERSTPRHRLRPRVVSAWACS